MSAESILAVIPARGGSKGLPGKNIRLLHGVPLIAHSILCARMTPSITRTIISTDSEEIARVAREYGGDVPFLRPGELATDTAAMTPVLRHALLEAEREDGRRYDRVLLLDPTSPGRTPADIAAAAALLDSDPQCDGVIGVSEPEFNPYWHCVIENDGYMQDLMPGASSFSRRQDLPDVYRINGALYLWRRSVIAGDRHWRTARSKIHIIPEERAIHIDDAAQFERASLLLERGLIRFPWIGPSSALEERAHA